jgi:thioredoxin-like negative regulator of GroEL
VADYKKAIEAATSDGEKATPQYQLVSVYEKLLKTYKGNKKDTTDLSNEYGSLAWYQLFAKQFAEAEQSARHGLALDASQEWINTNLASALLFQGKWEAAKAIYMLLKDKPFNNATFKQAFLEDLEAFEKVGITHADVTKIRALLKE